MTRARSDVERAVRNLAPRIPRHEFISVVDHAMDSAGLRSASVESAAWLSLVAYARHVHTDYDELLDQGYDVDSARHFVKAQMQDVLDAWGVTKSVDRGST